MAHFDYFDNDLFIRLSSNINSKFQVAAGVLIKLIMKHKYFLCNIIILK